MNTPFIRDNTILKLSDISKYYGNIKALNAINISLHSREIIGLIGADSAGKSTLTKIIGGLEQPDSGLLYIDGIPTKFKSAHEARQHGIEIISSEDTLSPSLDVAHNIFIGRWPRTLGIFLDKKTMYADARKLLDQIGLGYISEKQLTGELSGGLRHVISVARAISFHPKIIVFDEPMMHLSVTMSEYFISLMRQLKESGVCQVFATRRPQEALKVCDRIIVMRYGQVIAEVSDQSINETSESELAALMIGA